MMVTAQKKRECGALAAWEEQMNDVMITSWLRFTLRKGGGEGRGLKCVLCVGSRAQTVIISFGSFSSCVCVCVCVWFTSTTGRTSRSTGKGL